MKRNFTLLCLFSLVYFSSLNSLTAQYTIKSIRIGPSLAMQRWNGVGNNAPLPAFHAALALESYDPGSPFAFFGELGYHQRGMQVRVQPYQNSNGIDYPGYTIKNKFHNVALALGGRKHFGAAVKYYYCLALRLEYTIRYDLGTTYEGFGDFVRRFNYGLDIGGGIDFPIGLHTLFAQVMFQPDASKQIYSLRFSGYDYQGNPVTFPEQRVFNYTFELSLGFRLFGNAVFEEEK